MKKSTIFLSLFMMLAVCVNSQTLKVFEEWTTSNGTQNMFLETFTETDANRNVYVGGATVNSIGDYNILLTKYDSRGNLLWTEQYAGAGNGDDAAAAICFGDSGNVYLTGTVYTSANNQNDCVVLKYDQYGNLMWARTYNGNAYGPDFGTDICIDASNNVYIGGTSTRTGTYYDFLVLKYDRGGVYQWVSFYNNLNLFEIANKIELNGSTVVVAGGTQVNATKWEYAVANFSASTGSFTGVKTTASTGTGIDQINDLCIDGSGNLYVTGGVVNANTGYDYQTVKLNDSLDVQWTATYNNTDSLDDVARSVQVDASGNVYVTGYSLTQDEDTNIVTIKYNSSGTQQWVQVYNDDDDGCDKGEALVVDGSGNIFVAATYFNGSNSDFLTLKYNEDGDLHWKMTYNGLYNLNDEAKDICLDDDGDIIVVGQSCIGDGYVYKTVKYSEIDVIIPPDDEAAPLAYSANLGQLTDTGFNQVPDVKFYAKYTSPVPFFWDDKVSYVLTDSNETTGLFDSWRIDMEFIEPSSELKVRAFDELDYYSNFYLSHIPEGRARVKSYNIVIYYELYENVDLLISSNNIGPKLYYIIKPGGTPDDIHCLYSGVDSSEIGNDDELILYTGLGNIVYPQAVAYQIDSNGDTINLAWQPEYDLSSNHLYFTTGSYNTSLPLVIEMKYGKSVTTPPPPVGNLDYCTSWGTARNEHIVDVYIDNGYYNGGIYLVGSTNTSSFPITVGLLSYAGQTDAFVVYMDHNTDKWWETYYGGSGMDEPCCIETGARSLGSDPLFPPEQNFIYITGQTVSDNIPNISLSGAHDDHSKTGQTDIFIARFTPKGGCDWSVYYGGDDGYTAYERPYDMTITYEGQDLVLYIVGHGHKETPLVTPTGFTGFTYSTTNSGFFGLIMKFDNSLYPEWVTLYPVDVVNGIDIWGNSNGDPCIYIVGNTSTTSLEAYVEENDSNFPLTASLQTFQGSGQDAFVASFDSDHAIEMTQYIGGTKGEYGQAISVNYDYILLSGATKSEDFLHIDNSTGYPHHYEPNISNQYYADAFITKIARKTTASYALGEIVYSTYYGGTYAEYGTYVDMDYQGNYVIFGSTKSKSPNKIQLPSTNPTGTMDNTDKFGNDEWDAYIAYFAEDARLIWATYFGSDPDDYAWACRLNNDNLFIWGHHYWTDAWPEPYNYLPLTPDGNTTPTPDFYTEPAFFQYSNPLAYNSSNGYLARFVLPEIPQIVNIEETDKPGLKVYPNPTENSISICSDKNCFLEHAEIYDITGKLVLTQYFNKGLTYTVVNISQLKPGVYHLLIYSDNGEIYSHKIVKIKN